MHLFLLFPFLLLAFPHRKQDGSLITESGQSNRRILDTSSANLSLSQIFHHILQIEYQVDADFCILTNAYICFTVYPSFHTDICIRCYAGSCEIRSIIAVIKLFVDIHISAHLDPDTFSIVFLILGFTIVKPFYASQIGNADVEIMNLGIDYLSTVMIFSFGLFTQIFFERLLTSTGRTIFSMTSQLCGAITNIILDPIMIFGLLGFPKMGVTGAAVATVIGQCVAGIVAGTCNHKYNHEVSLSFKGFRPDISLIGHIYAVGIPSIIMQSIGSIMTYSMNRILIEFSSTATAVFGVYFKLQSFFFMPVFGLNNGITPIIAYNYGAQQRKRMIRTIKISLTTAFCLTFIGFLCFEGIPQVLLGMFNASADMLKIGVPALRIIGIHYLIAWFCIIAGTVFQALGKAVFSMIVSIMRQLVVLIPAAYILSKIGGLHVVWWSFPIAEVISFIVSMAFLIRIYKTIISKIPEGKL